MGEKQNQPFQLSFNASLKTDFQPACRRQGFPSHFRPACCGNQQGSADFHF
jgi:hypothetical protein